MSQSSDQDLLVNLGCGERIHPAWSNYDLHSRQPGVVACDFLNGIPLKDGTASVVYCAAVLEHIRLSSVPAFLGECHRVLRPGGIIRLAVPDFEQQAKLYLELVSEAAAGVSQAADKLEWLILEMIDQVGRNGKGGAMAAYLARKGRMNEEFIVSRIGKEGRNLIEMLEGKRMQPADDFSSYRSWMVRGGLFGVLLLKFLLKSRNIRKDLAALQVGRFRLFQGEVHQWIYDRASLSRLLEESGFGDLKVMEHGESRIPHWKTYHLEVDENGIIEKPDLVIVEGVKTESGG